MSESEPMFLPEVEKAEDGPHGEVIRRLRTMGAPVPQILHLFAYKPGRTMKLAEMTQDLLRGPSPLSAGQRELIAAFVSRRNNCPY